MRRRALIGLLGIVALQLAFPATFRAQSTENVVRSWSCLLSSAANGSIFSGAASTACGPTTPSGPLFPLGGRQRAADIAGVPGAPVGLTAAVSGSTVVLTWSPLSSGGTPTNYVLQAGSSSGLANLANANTGSSSPTLTATGVGAGSYFVRVLANNASGTSAPSNEIVVVVSGAGGCNIPPAVPTGLATSSNGSNVTLTWQTPAVGCPPTSYIIQAGSTPGASNLANFSTGNTATSFSTSGVGAGVYYIRILAANGAGTSGPSPDVALVVGGGGCGAAPGASPSLSVSVSGSTVTFAWLPASGAAAYVIQVGSTPGAANLVTINAGNALSYTATGAPNGTYYARLVATNGCGTGPASNEVVAAVGGPAGATLAALHGFTGSPGDGSNWSTLTQSSDGNFYGTSVTGGPFNNACGTNLQGCGLLFRLTPSGAFTVLYTFFGTIADHNAQPIYPYGALTQASDGNFYGTTSEGPSVFRMTPSGAFTQLTFLGGGSYSKLVQGADGALYGTTALGGPGTCSADRSAVCFPQAGNSGTVFKVTTGGALTTLHTFTGGADGAKPYGGIILGNDGSFYGTTQTGGAGFGTIYKIRSDGTFTTLYAFTGGADGAYPYAALTQGSDGTFYGSTQLGTSYNVGTIFKITSAGTFTLLHTFTGFSVPDGAPRPGIPLDGAYPAAPLVQLPDGRFVGVSAGGGSLSGGTVFTITSAGAYSQVAVFSGNAEGSSPIWLIRASDGNLYGNAQYGGVVNQGAIFRLTPP